MSVTLKPGVTHTIQITDGDDTLLHSQQFQTEDDCNTFLNTYGKSRVGPSHLDFLFTVDSILLKPSEYFEKLFFPTVKQFHSYLHAPLDLAMLPFRLIGTPMAALIDWALPDQPHPLATLIKREDLSSVNLVYTKETVEKPKVEKKLKVTRATKETVTGKQQLFLKMIPCQRETKMEFTSGARTYQQDTKTKKWDIGTMVSHSETRFSSKGGNHRPPRPGTPHTKVPVRK